MTGSEAPPATASGPGVPYPEWPGRLGDPRWHRADYGSSSAVKSRIEIVAQYRERRPNVHAPAAAKQQLAHAKELQNTKFPARLCSFQVQCRRGAATKKCLHCIQYDDRKPGFYCDACFAARHPPYRMEHAWSPVQDEVNPEQSWMAHLTYHNLEQDARELQILLAQTQAFLQSQTGSSKPPAPRTAASRPGTRVHPRLPPTAIPAKRMRTPTGEIDFQRVRESVTTIASTLKDLVEQIHAELAKKPLTREDALLKIQAMWRIRKARKQMRELIQSVYQSFTDPTTGETYYYNTRTKETKWSKPKGLGTTDLAKPKPPRNQEDDKATVVDKAPRVSKLQQLASEEERRQYAAQVIQGMARAHHARHHFRKLISSVYEKIWDTTSSRFYYHNTRTDEVKWQKPRWVSDDELLTPRTRDRPEDDAERQLKERKLAELRSKMTVEGAATMVQRAFRKRRGFAMLLEMCRGVYERIYDENAGMYYYHNTRTKEVSWDKPLLLRNTQADVLSPRSRQQRLQKLLAPAMASRPQIVWTEETAAVRLQGLYRARQARRDLDARLAQAYKKVWDPSCGMFYYANLQTGVVSWERPAILQRRQAVDVEELK